MPCQKWTTGINRLNSKKFQLKTKFFLFNFSSILLLCVLVHKSPDMHRMILIVDLLFIVGRKLQGDQNPAPHHHQDRNGTGTRVGGNTTSVCAVNVIPPNGLAGNGWSVGIAIWPQPRLSLWERIWYLQETLDATNNHRQRRNSNNYKSMLNPSIWGGRSLAKTLELIIDFCRNCDNKSVFPGVLASFFVFFPQKLFKEKDIWIDIGWMGCLYLGDGVERPHKDRVIAQKDLKGRKPCSAAQIMKYQPTSPEFLLWKSGAGKDSIELIPF